MLEEYNDTMIAVSKLGDRWRASSIGVPFVEEADTKEEAIRSIKEKIESYYMETKK